MRGVRPKPRGATRRCRTPGRLEIARLGGSGGGGGGGGNNCAAPGLVDRTGSDMISGCPMAGRRSLSGTAHGAMQDAETSTRAVQSPAARQRLLIRHAESTDVVMDERKKGYGRKTVADIELGRRSDLEPD
jgi:hypothetical protein